MSKLDQEECREFCGEICDQKTGEVLAKTKELINQVIDGNIAMENNLKLKVAMGLLTSSQYQVVPKREPVIFEMAPAVSPNKYKIDLWQAIVDGRKVIDVRARTEKYDPLDVDDIVYFQRPDGAQIPRRIGLVFKADNVEQLLESIIASELFSGNSSIKLRKTIAAITPGVISAKDFIRVINAWPDNEKKIEKHGVVAFFLLPLTPKEFVEYNSKQRGWGKKVEVNQPKSDAEIEAEFVRLGWHKKITGTGAVIFTKPMIDVRGRIPRWQAGVVEGNQKDVDDFREEDQIGIIEQP